MKKIYIALIFSVISLSLFAQQEPQFTQYMFNNMLINPGYAGINKRICLTTTNDNLKGIGFWQKRGFKLVRVYPNAMEYTRKLKPAVPLLGENGIPLRDELELEMIL